jgi:hypothetical protein
MSEKIYSLHEAAATVGLKINEKGTTELWTDKIILRVYVVTEKAVQFT